ncbi:MAG: hypothetical protein JW828_14860 [Sedimentisphaerales bacterium]|nr:hypothetical protein [Sedimentisphaerales bacterium]
MRYKSGYRVSLGIILLWLGVASTVRGDLNFFQSKPTELESMNIIRELYQLKPVPGVGIPRPEIYSRPPEIVEGTISGNPEAKLYYFCQYHSAGELVGLLSSQFVEDLNDNAGNPIPGVPYNISQNPSTQQIIVACSNRPYAEQVLAFLRQVDVPPIQVKIDCLVSEVYADHTMDWQTQMEIENLFGQEITLSGLLPGAALRDAARNSFGMDLGYVTQADQPGHKFSFLIDMLASRGYLKVLMNPQLEVVNGQSATIRAVENPPLQDVSTVDSSGNVIFSGKTYAQVVDSLQITPTVFIDGTIGIRTQIITGSKSTPEGVAQNPIVTQREIIVKENRVRSGQSLVIGGITKTEQRSVVRGVPLLKDIPIVGIMFSSKDYEERGKEVLFIITPTISLGGVPNDEVVAEMHIKHDPLPDQSLMGTIVDPFGAGVYTKLVEGEATRADVRRTQAEMDKLHAQRKARELEDKLDKVRRQIEADYQRTTQSQEKIEQVKTTLDEATVTATAAQTEAQQAQKALEDVKTAQAAAEAEKQQALAEKAAAEKAKQDTEAEIAAWLKSREKQAAQGEPPKQETPPPPK